jgi:CubicO group peptidase (beta-lactamase class C family)
MKPQFVCLLLVFCLLLVGCGGPAAASGPVATATPDPFTQSLNTFEVELEALRQEMKIAGMSAAVVKDGQLVWAHGFGYADIENGIPATAETPYHLALSPSLLPRWWSCNSSRTVN